MIKFKSAVPEMKLPPQQSRSGATGQAKKSRCMAERGWEESPEAEG